MRRRARHASTRSSRCARSGSSTRPRSARSPTRGACACSTATRWSATCRSPRWSTSARSTTSSRSPRACRCTRRRSRCPTCPPIRAGLLLALLGSANLASRRWAFEQYDCLVGSRTVRRPEAADAAVLAAAGRLGDRGLDRRQRPPRRLRPLPRRGRGRARVQRPTSPASAPSRSGSPTASTSATPRSRTSPGSSRARSPASPTPAARSRSRSSAATSRSTTRPARARSSRPRSSAWSASCRRPPRSGRLGFAQEGDVVAVISAGSWAPAADGLRAREAARRGAVRRAPARRPRRAARAPRRGPPGGARGRAALGPRRRRGRPRGRAGRGVPGGRARRHVDLSPLRPAGEALLFGEGPGAFVVSGPEQSLRAFGGAAVRIGTVGGADLVIDGALSVPVAELSAAHAAGWRRCSTERTSTAALRRSGAERRRRLSPRRATSVRDVPVTSRSPSRR